MDKETALKLGLAAFVIFIVFFVSCPTTKERFDEYFDDDEGFEDEDFREYDDD